MEARLQAFPEYAEEQKDDSGQVCFFQTEEDRSNSLEHFAVSCCLCCSMLFLSTPKRPICETSIWQPGNHQLTQTAGTCRSAATCRPVPPRPGPEESLFVLRPAIFSARPETISWLKADRGRQRLQ